MTAHTYKTWAITIFLSGIYCFISGCGDMYGSFLPPRSAPPRPFSGVDQKQPKLLQAIEDGDLATVKSLVNKQTVNDPIEWVEVDITDRSNSPKHFYWYCDTKHEYSFPPLVLAFRERQKSIAEHLLSISPNISAEAYHSWLQITISQSVNPDFDSREQEQGKKSRVGGDLLHLASEWDRDIAEALLREGANLNARDRNGKTPLDIAVMNKKEDIVRLLLTEGARMDGNRGMTPLHYAAESGGIEIVKLFLNQGVTVNAKRSDDFRTPLHLAAENMHIDIVQLLIEHGAIIESKDKKGKTCLDILREKGYSDSEIEKLRDIAERDKRALEFAQQEKERKLQEQQWSKLRDQVEAAVKNKELKKAVSILKNAKSQGLGGAELDIRLAEIYRLPEWLESRPKICIQKFDISEDISPGMTSILYNTLIGELTASKIYTVVDWEELERVNKFISDSQPNLSIKDAKKQAMNQMGVNQLYVGSAYKFGTEKVQYEMTVKIINFDLVVVASYQDTVGSEDEMKDCTKKIAQKIINESTQ